MNESIEIGEIEVGGVKVKELKDRSGQVWAVPADDSNIDLREFRNIFEIPDPDPLLFYQYVDGGRLNEFLNTGYRKVAREHVGIPTAHDASGQPLTNSTDTYHQVGNLHLVAIPKVIADKRRSIQKMRADEATASIKIPRQLGKSLTESGVQVRERVTERVMGPAMVTSAKEFKTFDEEEV